MISAVLPNQSCASGFVDQSVLAPVAKEEAAGSNALPSDSPDVHAFSSTIASTENFQEPKKEPTLATSCLNEEASLCAHHRVDSTTTQTQHSGNIKTSQSGRRASFAEAVILAHDHSREKVNEAFRQAAKVRTGDA